MENRLNLVLFALMLTVLALTCMILDLNKRVVGLEKNELVVAEGFCLSSELCEKRHLINQKFIEILVEGDSFDIEHLQNYFKTLDNE